MTEVDRLEVAGQAQCTLGQHDAEHRRPGDRSDRPRHGDQPGDGLGARGRVRTGDHDHGNAGDPLVAGDGGKYSGQLRVAVAAQVTSQRQQPAPGPGRGDRAGARAGLRPDGGDHGQLAVRGGRESRVPRRPRFPGWLVPQRLQPGGDRRGRAGRPELDTEKFQRHLPVRPS